MAAGVFSSLPPFRVVFPLLTPRPPERASSRVRARPTTRRASFVAVADAVASDARRAARRTPPDDRTRGRGPVAAPRDSRCHSVTSSRSVDSFSTSVSAFRSDVPPTSRSLAGSRLSPGASRYGRRYALVIRRARADPRPRRTRRTCGDERLAVAPLESHPPDQHVHEPAPSSSTVSVYAQPRSTASVDGVSTKN